jgi:hypothetical protein
MRVMPILDTKKYKELEGVGQLVSDLVLTLLSWMTKYMIIDKV